MSGRCLTESLRRLCADIDAGRATRRIPFGRVLLPLAVPAAIGLALGTAGCRDERDFDPVVEICDNAVDDDGDGVSDCADADCFGDIACASLYGGPFEDCDNDVDDDGDDLVDCDDPTCETFADCNVEYGAPFEDCNNLVDDDGDGDVDCDDDDCLGTTDCTPMAYGVLFEICDNEIDDDGDGDIDCADADCQDEAPCWHPPPYAAPFEGND